MKTFTASVQLEAATSRYDARTVKAIIALLLVACASSAEVTSSSPHEVAISGYAGTAMEPFITRDGKFLLFNNSNDPATNTDIFYARRENDLKYVFVGPVAGVNTSALEGTPTMDRAGTLFFVSTRSYAGSACTIYSAQFDGGQASAVQLVDSICRHEPGIVNFDVDTDPAGTLMTFVDSQFGANAQPQTADLVMAAWDGAQFVRLTNSASLLAQVNTNALEYAPAITADRLTLYFTRLTSMAGGAAPQIWRARRNAPTEAFGIPVRLDGLGDFVEAPALSSDEKLLYFHRRVGSDYKIFTFTIW